MTNNRTILVRCRFRRSAFSGERIFILSWGAIGAAPAHYCLRLDSTEPIVEPPKDAAVEGRLAGIWIVDKPPKSPTTLWAELPDGEVYEVDRVDVLVMVKRATEWEPLDGNTMGTIRP